jgi:hypothetical protein
MAYFNPFTVLELVPSIWTGFSALLVMMDLTDLAEDLYEYLSPPTSSLMMLISFILEACEAVIKL